MSLVRPPYVRATLPLNRIDRDREYPHPDVRLYPDDVPAPVRTARPVGGVR